MEKVFTENQYPFIIKTFSKLRIIGYFLELMKNNIVFNGEMVGAYSSKARNENKCLF